MATSREFHDYVVENLQRVGSVSTRKMMGEYCVYYHGKLIGDICNDRLFLKPTESVLRLMPDADRAYPYEGSKILMVVADDVEDRSLMAEVLNGMYKELPEPKKKTGRDPTKRGKDSQEENPQDCSI